MIGIPDRQLEIAVIIDLLRKVHFLRIFDRSECNKCIFLAKLGLDRLADEIVEQAKSEGKEPITELDLTKEMKEIEEPSWIGKFH